MNNNLGLKLDFDDIAIVFKATIGSVRGSLGMVIWSWAKQAQLSLSYHEFPLSTWLFIYWCIIVTIIKSFAFLNHKICAPAKWEISPKTTIIITGGAQGLGLLLAAQFSSQNFSTIILDIHEAQFMVANSTFYKVDVSDYASVKSTISKIKAENANGRFVLINCAGSVADTMGKFTDLEPSAIRNVVSTNLLGSMWTTQELLKCENQLDMVVFISSTTALASPARAGVYASSKAGIRTFAESLSYELRGSNTRVLLITPGQLDTKMFEQIETPSKFWAPVVSSSQLSLQIYTAVLKGEVGELRIPEYAKLLPYILLLPKALILVLRRIIGIDDSVHT